MRKLTVERKQCKEGVMCSKGPQVGFELGTLWFMVSTLNVYLTRMSPKPLF